MYRMFKIISTASRICKGLCPLSSMKINLIVRIRMLDEELDYFV